MKQKASSSAGASPALTSARRKCVHCGGPMRHVAGHDGWNLFSQRLSSPLFLCEKCGHSLTYYGWHEILGSVLVYGVMLALLALDGHPFWFVTYTLAHPLEAGESLARDGLFAMIGVPLFMIFVGFFLVALPLLGLGYAAKSLWLRLRYPSLSPDKSEGAEEVPAASDTTSLVDDGSPGPSRFSVRDIWPAFKKATMGQALFLVLALVVLRLPDGKLQLQSFLEAAIPVFLLGEGFVWGVQRWLVSAFWFLMLPVTAFLLFVLGP